ANGTLDTAFGESGIGLIDTPRRVIVFDLAIDQSGRFVAVNGDIGSMDRWTASGDPDTTFGSGGFANANVSGPVVAIDSKNRIQSTFAGLNARFFSSPEDRP